MAKKKKPRKKSYNPGKMFSPSADLQQKQQRLAKKVKQDSAYLNEHVLPGLALQERLTWPLDFGDQQVLPVDVSKQGGAAYSYKEQEWPRCDCCQSSMVLMLQIMPKDQPLPLQDLTRGEVFQLFVCRNCPPAQDAMAQDNQTSGHIKVRYLILDQELAEDHKNKPKELPDAAFPLVLGEASIDYPGLIERHIMGIELSDENNQRMQAAGFPKTDDKLFGWPRWLHTVGWNPCPECGQVMTPVLQIKPDSRLLLDWPFNGVFYLASCAEHRDQIQGLWQDLSTALEKSNEVLTSINQ